MLPVLLAAGLGRRLGGCAKALYPLDGLPLMHRSAHRVAEVGFDEMLVVTGQDRDSVIEYWATHDPPLKLKWLHNERYAELNNFYTVALACEASRGPLLLINSDIVFDAIAILATIEAPGKLRLAVDDSTVDHEAMGVRVVDGKAVELGKHLTGTHAAGEFIGISVIADEARAEYLSESQRALRNGESQVYYEDLYARLAARRPAGVARVPRDSWAEIDVPDDVPRARQVAARQGV